MKSALTLAFVAAMTATAHADRVTVAIVPGLAVNLDSARVDALGQDLADALTAELDVDAAGGLEVRRKLPADGVPPDCLNTPSCVADVASRLGANQLLFVVMVDPTGSGAVQIDSTWVDVASGKRVARPAIDLPTVAEAKSRFASAAHTLLPDAPARPKPKTGSGGGGSIGTMSPEIPKHFTTASYVTAGVSVVGLGIWVGFGLATRSKFNSCDSPGACGEAQRDTIRNRGLIADVGLAVGLGGAIATSVLVMTSGKESHLVVGPTGQGVAVTAVGRF